ncbi:MAG: hypothetical protein JRN52_09305 [Nitrososphaerota archaeon]|nr:hypothetical protein [Nitrososphaerota archaeon]
MTEQDAVAEARRLVAAAEGRGVTLRLLGGIAFRLRSPSSLSANLSRHYVDIDFIGLRNQRKHIQNMFTDLGYQPRTTFNAMNGHTRLIFNDIERERRVDIFLNVFEMCHKFDFTNRLTIDKTTLPLADLLLTKLQVYEITEREYRDVIAFLKDNQLGDRDGPDTINQSYISKLCSDDWGLYRTVTLNLDRISKSLSGYLNNLDEQALVDAKINDLRKTLEEHEKSFSWKLRAKVGEKVKWYQLPEADREVVDSRPGVERLNAELK